MEHISIDGIPAIIQEKESERVYIAVHGKMGSKEDFSDFAVRAGTKGYQTLSFDLPEHGERKGCKEYQCNIWNGMHDLKSVMSYARSNWQEICIAAVSLGAFFSLMTYQEEKLEKCLFISPVLDMAELIRHMMEYDGITEEELEHHKRIPSSSGEVLDFEYYRFVCEHPVPQWAAPTHILYGGQDELTPRQTVESFTDRFNCDLTIAESCRHWFHTPDQLAVLSSWFDRVL
jgi:uncharacterized protein